MNFSINHIMMVHNNIAVDICPALPVCTREGVTHVRAYIVFRLSWVNIALSQELCVTIRV